MEHLDGDGPCCGQVFRRLARSASADRLLDASNVRQQPFRWSCFRSGGAMEFRVSFGFGAL
jgi:hypothetical protein